MDHLGSHCVFGTRGRQHDRGGSPRRIRWLGDSEQVSQVIDEEWVAGYPPTVDVTGRLIAGHGIEGRESGPIQRRLLPGM
ncbi:MAG: hypothetical protein QOE59_3728 [Actinomycetota bacterium]|jgi:hypothetical protein|nr:hypothetical protein [Actinomycetota bacterium]